MRCSGLRVHLTAVMLWFVIAGCGKDSNGTDSETYLGTFDFAITSSSTDHVKAYGIDSTSDGYIYITGDFRGNATFGLGEANETTLINIPYTDEDNANFFLAKYNPYGILIWAVQANSSWMAHGYDVAVLDDGTAFVTGAFCDDITFGAGEENETTLVSPNGLNSILVARYNPDGTLCWAKQDYGECADIGRAIDVLPDGTSFVCGDFGHRSYGDNSSAVFGMGEVNETTLDGYGYDRLFVAKYNPNGTLCWVKDAGGSDTVSGRGIVAAEDGSCYVTGYIYGQNTVFGSGEVNQTTYDAYNQLAYIARYNSDGSLGWASFARGPMKCGGSDIALMSDGCPVICGQYENGAVLCNEHGNITLTGTAWTWTDAFIAKFDKDGMVVWAETMFGDNFDYADAMTIDNRDNIYVTGKFRGSMTFGKGGPNETSISTIRDWDFYIACFNKRGSFKWISHSGGDTCDVVRDITCSEEKWLVCTGYHGSNPITFGLNEPGECCFYCDEYADIFIEWILK